MSFRNTVIAVIVLAGLVGFIYYYEYLGEEGREAALAAQENVFHFDKDRVRKIRIEPAGRPAVELSKEGARWDVGATPPVAADTSKVESLLSSLNNLRIVRTLEGAASEDLGQYKLDEPPLRIEMEYEDADQATIEASIAIGDKAPVGGEHYALRPDGEDVLLVSGGIESLSGADAGDLRDRKLTGIPSYEVESVRLRRGEREVSLARREGEWLMEEPVSFHVESAKIDDVLFELQSAEASGFESEEPGQEELSSAGLAEPSLTLSLESRERETPLEVMFGAAGDDGAIRAMRSDRKAIMKVDAALVAKLDGIVDSPDSLRDARVAPFNRFRLSRLEVDRDQETIALHKGDDSKWRWQSADGPALPSEQVNALLDAIEGLKAEGYEDGAPAADRAGVRVTLSEDGDEEASGVTLTALGGGRFLSSRSDAVYIVPEGAAGKLAEALAGIQEPRPEPGPATDDETEGPVDDPEPGT